MKPEITITSSTVNHNTNTTDMTQVFQFTTSETTDDFTESDISITGSYITSFENLGYSIENTIAGWDSDTSLNIDNQSGRNHTTVISGDGTTIATCYDTERGEWRIFKDISDVWTQVGSTLLDTQDVSYSVTNGITLNYDGTAIAFSTGERIYTYHYENDVWSQTGDISGWGGVVQQDSSSVSVEDTMFKYLRLYNDGSDVTTMRIGELEVYVDGVNICRDSEHGYDSLDMTTQTGSDTDTQKSNAVNGTTYYGSHTAEIPGYWLIEFTNSYLLSDVESVKVKVWTRYSNTAFRQATRGVQIEFMNSSQTIINNTVRIPDDQNGDYTHTSFTLIDSLDLSAASPLSEPISYFNHFLEQAQQSPYLDISVAETEVIECVSLNTIVNVVSSDGNKYVFNNSNSYTEGLVYGLYDGSYTFTDISENHPMAILNDGKSDSISYTGDADKKFTKDVDGVSYDFYYGDMSVSVSGDFDVVSIYCYYHGYMGGENLLTYSISCEQIPTTTTTTTTSTLSGNFQYIYLNTADMGSWANALIEVKGTGVAANAARLTCMREIQVWVDVNGTSTNVATAAGGAEIMFVDPSTNDETITMVDGDNDYGGSYPITEILNNSISNSFGMQGTPSGYSITAEFVNSYSVLLKLPTTYNSTDLQSIVIYSRTNSHGASINWNVKILDENQSTLYETASITTDHVEETGPDRSTWTINHTNTENIFRFDTTSLPTDLLVNSGTSSTTGVINTSGVVSIVEVINIDSSSSTETEYDQYYITHTIPNTVGLYTHSNFARSLAMNRAGDAIFIGNIGSGRSYQNYCFALVYKQVSGIWSQRGNMLTIMNGNQSFGGTYGFMRAIFSDDGDTIVISYAVNQVGITNGTNNTGDIRVIKYDSSSDTWVFKGNYIDNVEISTSHHSNGQIFSMGTDGTANAATGARFIGKSSFDMSSDGSIIAIYSFFDADIIIYKYENTYTSSWDTIGTISSQGGRNSSNFRTLGGLSMNSDGTRVAFSNGATDFIEVWEYVSDNNWVKISSGITENNFSSTNQGVLRSYASPALRLNDDGDTLIYAGSTSDDAYNDSNFGTEGDAYVYTYAGSGTTWTQKGQTLPCTGYQWCQLAINGPGNIIALIDREEEIVNYGGTSLRIYEYNTANDQWAISQTLLNTVQIENEANNGWMFIAMNYLGDRIITSELNGIEANIYERDPSFVRYVEIIQDTSSTPSDYYTPRRNHINLSSIEIYIDSSSLSITNDMVSSSTGWNNDESYENYLNQTNTFFNTAASENGTSILIDLSQNYLYSIFNAVRIVAPSSTNFNPGIKINLLDGESTVVNTTQIPLDASSSESCIIIYNDSSVLPTSDYSETIQSGTSSETETITCMYATSAVDVVSSDGNKYVFNGSSSYVEGEVYGMYDGYYVWSDISESHPMAILNDGKTDFITYIGDEDKKLTTQVNDISYDFYYGNIQVSVSGDFGYVSVYCYHHGYMGGENRLKYTDTCSDVRVSSSYVYDLIGTSKSGKNMSLNNNGDIMAVGHPRHDIDTLEGSVLIWQYDASGIWNQIGNLVHEHGYGYACRLNGDGDILILGSPIVPSGQFYSMGQGVPYIEAGLVRVFQYKTITEAEYDAGNTLNHLNESDLTIIGSGSMLSTVDQNIPWSSTTKFWVQIGSDFQGTHHYSHMGKSVDIDQSGNHIGFTSVDSSNVAQIHLYTLDTSSNTWDSLGNTINTDGSCSSIRLSGDGYRLLAWDDDDYGDTALASVYRYDSSENLWIEEENNSHLGWQDLSGTDLSQNRSLDMSKDGNRIIRSLEGEDIELYARNTSFQVSVHVLGYIRNNSIFVQEGVFHDTDDISNAASNVFNWKYDSPHTLHSVQFIENTNNFDFDLVAFEFSGQLPVEFTFKHIFYQRGFIEGVDSSAVAVIDVSASDYNDLFKLNFPFFYPSDNFYEFIGTLRYLTKASGWTDISFSTASVNSGYISTATTIKRDVLRSFIKDLTGSPNLNRLFKNKLPMMLEVETLDVSFNAQIKNLLGAIENAGWLTDDDYNALQPDDQTYSFDGTFENYSGGEDISDVSAGYANLADMSEFSKFNPLRILSSSILGEPDADTTDQFDISGAGLGNRIRRNILIDSLQTQVEQHWNDISGRAFVSQIGDDLYNVYMEESAAIAAGTDYIEQNGGLFSSYLSNLTVYTDTSNVPVLTAENSLLQNVVDKEYSFSFISGDNLHILLTYNPEHPVMGNKRVSPRCYEVILRMT